MNYFVNLFVAKINNKEINPKTGQPFTVDDIKSEDIKSLVKQELSE